MVFYSANTTQQTRNVEVTSYQHQSTLVQRYFNVVCPLGKYLNTSSIMFAMCRIYVCYLCSVIVLFCLVDTTQLRQNYVVSTSISITDVNTTLF